MRTEDIIYYMYEYQKMKNAKRHCTSNTQFLRDCIIASGGYAKVKACIVIPKEFTDMELHIIIHLIVVNKDETDPIDPSYEIVSMGDIQYITSIPVFMKIIKDMPIPKEDVRLIIENYLIFINLANRANAGELLVDDKEYYNGQADFIQSKNGKCPPGKSNVVLKATLHPNTTSLH